MASLRPPVTAAAGWWTIPRALTHLTASDFYLIAHWISFSLRLWAPGSITEAPLAWLWVQPGSGEKSAKLTCDGKIESLVFWILPEVFYKHLRIPTYLSFWSLSRNPGKARLSRPPSTAVSPSLLPRSCFLRSPPQQAPSISFLVLDSAFWGSPNYQSSKAEALINQKKRLLV